MKPTTLLVAAAAVFSSAAEARACTEGLSYCGWNLLKVGNYRDEIVAELTRNGKPINNAYIGESLFNCHSDGWITYKTYCGVCKDGHSGKSDYCPMDIGK
ncbi:hypothetical protein ACHAQC_011890 [Fusarium culmorum]